jgi:Sigma-70, region 4
MTLGRCCPGWREFWGVAPCKRVAVRREPLTRSGFDRETPPLLSTALTRLPDPYREVLEGRLVHGQDPSEIASELGQEPATVYVRTHRGLHLLRRLLPVGLAPSAWGQGAAGQSLAPVRRAVLTTARRHAGLLPSSSIGVLPLVSSVAAALLALIAGTWYFLRPDDAPVAAVSPIEASQTPPPASGEIATLEPGRSIQRSALIDRPAEAGESATSTELVAPTSAVQDVDLDPVRWWVEGRVLAPSYVEHGELAWSGTKVRVTGPSVGMEFGVVRHDGFFRQPMLSQPPWESVADPDFPASDSLELLFTASHPELISGTRKVGLGERTGNVYYAELELLPAGRVQGDATDEAGVALTASFAQVYPLVGAELGSPAFSDIRMEQPSSYDLLAAPGDSVVVVCLGGLRPGSTRTRVDEGLIKTMPTLVLEAGATIEGSVRELLEPDVMIEAQLQDVGASRRLWKQLDVAWHRGRVEWAVVRASVDRGGNFTLPGLAPGDRYKITYGEREIVTTAGASRIEL